MYSVICVFRLGYKSLFNDDSEEGFTTGGGIKFVLGQEMALHLNYTSADFCRLQNAQRFSVRFEF